MHYSFIKKYILRLCILFVLISAIYGAGRIYYRVTDGFLESNIMYDPPQDPHWNTVALSKEKKKEIRSILSQNFFYLGKGCQSYVFRSQDDRYVVKFFKYQRFRPQAWLDYFTFLPFIDEYRIQKIEQKKQKLDNVFSSWKLAYEELPKETGVVYAHLNKSSGWNKNFIAYDKLGLKHHLDLNSLEFIVQKKASMLCPELINKKEKNDIAGAKEIFDKLLTLLLNEYTRGYADNDHALMQNTGVYEGHPIHIDVGQFVKNPIAADPKVYSQELFNKMWKFRRWLKVHFPELADYVDVRLRETIGPSYDTLTPQLNKASMGRIPYLPDRMP